MKKKVFLIWDLDGFIGAVNSSLPYNYSANHELELYCVEQSLEIMAKHNVKCTFAITGFSAEKGKYPYTFPELIQKIYAHGHEIASHSWRHEWVPKFSQKQIEKSLLRSKSALEKVVDSDYSVNGFVPPHNKPATWIRRGAYSLEDAGLYPLFKMGDMSNLLISLKKTNYKWVRIAHNPLINRLRKNEFTRAQKVFNYKGTLILENHYNGFDQKIINYIKEKNQEYFIVSAHPVMLSFTGERPESMENFVKFLNSITKEESIEFARPMDELQKFNIH